MYSILIVEDEYASRLGLQTIVKNSALQFKDILTANNGEEALTIIKNQHIDLVITDIRMPKMDGLQLCAKIHQKWPNIVIIIVSGYDDFKYAQQAIKYNVKDFILKPVKADNLTLSISQAIAALKTGTTHPISIKMISNLIDQLDHDLWNRKPFDSQASCTELLGLLDSLPHKEFKTFLEEILDELLQRSEQRLGVNLTPRQYGISYEDSRPNICFINSLNSLNAEICSQKADLNNTFIKQAKAYIEQNYNTDVSLSVIGQKCNLNPSYCSQLFKKKTGKTIVQYRTEIRMKKALDLLHRSDYTITEIALLIGYTDISHFSKTFKNFFGKSPSEYRISEVQDK
jgi:two-component system response regulator YesN